MRVFSAIFPPDEVVDDFSRALSPLTRRHPELTWTVPPLWHVTLTYFGNLALEDTQKLGGVMDRFAAGREPFRMRVDGATANPEPGEAESLHAAVVTPGDELLRLYLDGIDAVKQFGWVLDRRRFQPRIPLAYTEVLTDLRVLLDSVSEYQSPWWTVDSVATLWSRPGPDGTPFIELLGEHRLGAGQRRGS